MSAITNIYSFNSNAREAVNVITREGSDVEVHVSTTHSKSYKEITTRARAFRREGMFVRTAVTYRQDAPKPPLSSSVTHVARYSAKALEAAHYDNYGSVQSEALDTELFEWAEAWLAHVNI